MEFNWINLFNIGILLLIMIPNIIDALKTKNSQNSVITIPKYLTYIEQIGRYGCMFLMIFPIFVWQFGFRSVVIFISYLVINIDLLIIYDIVWYFYMKKKTLLTAMLLAIIPTFIFLISGLLLHHLLLVIFAVIFGYAHCQITYLTHKNINFKEKETMHGWHFVRTGIDGNTTLFDVNIFDYEWIRTNQKIAIKDPQYGKDYQFNVYHVIINGKEYEFAAGEFSNSIFGFYTHE